MTPRTLKRVSSTDRDISPPTAKRKQVASTTTNRAVANFFKPASQKEPEKVTFDVPKILPDPSWLRPNVIPGQKRSLDLDTLLVARYENSSLIHRPKPVKIAGFDLDDTLIATASGNRFSRNQDDWRWWHASVPTRLKKLHTEGYAILVFTNQGAVSLKSNEKTPKEGMRSLNNLKGKITAVLSQLELPITVYAATGIGHIFRKPRPGMWEQMLGHYGLTEPGDVDLEHSVFVGDAAGREGSKTAGVKKDHACSDRDFASNIGIAFKTPEEFFLGEETKPFVRSFDPAHYLGPEVNSATDATPVLFTKKNEVDIVLFCGSPGAGKSTFYWKHMKPLGYERVNQDILKSRDKCMNVATDFVEDGKPVAVDNTNADIETRAAWIALAKRLKVPIRLVHFTAPAKLCEHNDVVRALTGNLVSTVNTCKGDRTLTAPPDES